MQKNAMLRVLVAIDGSAGSMRAISHLIALREKLRPALEVLLINVQPLVPTLDMMLDGRPSDVRRLRCHDPGSGQAKAENAIS